MATIGSLQKTGTENTGEIITPSAFKPRPRMRTARWWPRGARHCPVKALDPRGRDCLGLKPDDPSFSHPIFANLFDDEDGEGYSLSWSRPNGNRRD